ncbi:Dynein regulatory complex subunit 6 [Sarracenia purpurea var. burkii]
MNQRRPCGGGGEGGGGVGEIGFLERLPNSIVIEILEKMDLETLCAASCVCRTIRSSSSQILSSLSTLDLSSFSPDAQTLNRVVYRFRGLKSVTLDCLRLDDSSISNLLGEHIQELNLLKGALLSYRVLASIGRRCPNLRYEYDPNHLRILNSAVLTPNLDVL